MVLRCLELEKIILFFALLSGEPRTFSMLDKHPTAKLYSFFKKKISETCLTTYNRLASNWRSSCLSPLSARILGVFHQAGWDFKLFRCGLIKHGLNNLNVDLKKYTLNIKLH